MNIDKLARRKGKGRKDKRVSIVTSSVNATPGNGSPKRLSSRGRSLREISTTVSRPTNRTVSFFWEGKTFGGWLTTMTVVPVSSMT